MEDEVGQADLIDMESFLADMDKFKASYMSGESLQPQPEWLERPIEPDMFIQSNDVGNIMGGDTTPMMQIKKEPKSAEEVDRLSKRKAQNRASQRLSRERKEKYVKDLENTLKVESMRSSRHKFENERLLKRIAELTQELETFKKDQHKFQFPESWNERDQGEDRQQQVIKMMTPPQSDQSVVGDSPPGGNLEDNMLVSASSESESVSQQECKKIAKEVEQILIKPPIVPPLPQPESQPKRIKSKALPQSAFDCPDVWEAIISHPRIDEVDMDALCKDLRIKAVMVWT